VLVYGTAWYRAQFDIPIAEKSAQLHRNVGAEGYKGYSSDEEVGSRLGHLADAPSLR
jgi:hypothetical protein